VVAISKTQAGRAIALRGAAGGLGTGSHSGLCCIQFRDAGWDGGAGGGRGGVVVFMLSGLAICLSIVPLSAIRICCWTFGRCGRGMTTTALEARLLEGGD